MILILYWYQHHQGYNELVILNIVPILTSRHHVSLQYIKQKFQYTVNTCTIYNTKILDYSDKDPLL